MEEKLFTIEDLWKYSETQLEKIFVQHDRIEERLSVQDVQFRRLWDAYKSIGITDPNCFTRLIEPIRKQIRETMSEAPYWEKYKQTNFKLDHLLGLLKNKDNDLELLNDTEKVIIDLVTLLNFHWEVLGENLGSICDKIQVSRDSERAKANEYWTNEPTLKDIPNGMEIRQAFAFEQQELIQQQINLMEKEQKLLTQMEFVCDERDRIFPISAGLFLK